jgi:hypothetical protein
MFRDFILFALKEVMLRAYYMENNFIKYALSNIYNK